MRVEVWIKPTLMKRLDERPVDSFRYVTEWVDDDSPTPMAAAERVWRVCSAGALDLSPMEREWQGQWRQHRGGYGFSIGDVAVVDESAFQVTPFGFEPLTWPVP